MTAEELGVLVRSWGRLPPSFGEVAARAARRAAREDGADALGAAVAETMAFGLGLPEGVAPFLALEGKPRVAGDEDPLEPAAKVVLGLLCGVPGGLRSPNGYLDFAQALGRAAARVRTNSSARLVAACLEAHGDTPVGVMEAVRWEDGARFRFAFTPAGLPVPREGMERRAALPLGALSGLGHFLDAGAALAENARASESGPPPRRPKPGTRRA